MTSLYKLNWPGMEELPVVLIDPGTSEVYSQINPLPISKKRLDVTQNRFVSMDDILNLFNADLREETEMIILSLQKRFCVQKIVNHSQKNETSNDNTTTSTKSYLPVLSILALLTVWPCCKAFENARNRLVDYLDYFCEKVCICCGFINRDCSCANEHNDSSLVSCMGYGVSVSEKAIQTDPGLSSPKPTNSAVVTSLSSLVAPSPNSVNVFTFPFTPTGHLMQPTGAVSMLPLSFPVADANGSPCTIVRFATPVTPNVSFPTVSNSSITTPDVVMDSSFLQPSNSISVQQPLLFNPNRPDSNNTKNVTMINSTVVNASPSVKSTVPLINSPAPNRTIMAVNFFKPTAPVSKEVDKNEKQASDLSNGVGPHSVYKISFNGHVANKKRSQNAELSRDVTVEADVLASGDNLMTEKPRLSSDTSQLEGSKLKDITDSHKKLGSSRDQKKSNSEKNSDASTEEDDSPLVNLKNKNNLSESMEDRDLALKKTPKLWQQLPDSDDDGDSQDENNESIASEGVEKSDTKLSTPVVECIDKPESSLRNDTEPMDTSSNHVTDTSESTENLNKELPDSNLDSYPKAETVEAKTKNKINGILDGVIDGDTSVVGSVDTTTVTSQRSDVDDIKDNADSSDETAEKKESDKQDSNGTSSAEDIKTSNDVSVAKTKKSKLYGKFEYLPTKEQLYKCLVTKCGQCFENKEAAILHNRCHNASKDSAAGLSCPECDDMSVSFYQWFDLIRHINDKHDVKICRLANTCSYCGLTFNSEEQLISHIDYHYSNRYKCIHCGLLLLSWNQVKRHMESCSSRHKSPADFGCPFCMFVFHKKTIRNIHLLSHADSGLVCAVCEDGVVWSDWKALRKHYQQKHAKIMQAKIEPFHSSLPIRRKPPPCSVCGSTFRSFDLFNTHMVRMHVYVPYVLVECSICLRQFRSEKSLDWHVRHAHGEELPCDKCNYVATSKTNLKAHVQENHQKKQHSCTECDKSFSLYSQLRVHMAHHARHTIHSCQHCDKEFKHTTDLKEHMQREHASQLEAAKKENYSCPECDYTCKSRLTLKIHVANHHPDLLESSLVLSSSAPTLDDDSDVERNHNEAQDDDDEETDDAFEDEDGEHMYSRSASSVSASTSAYGPLSRGVGRPPKRERKRKHYDDEWMETDWMDVDGDERKQRKRLKRLEKELEENIRRLQKSTSARTRPVNKDYAAVNRTRRVVIDWEAESARYDEWVRRMAAAQQNAAGEGVATTVTRRVVEQPTVIYYPEVLTRYPFIEHDYFKIAHPDGAEESHGGAAVMRSNSLSMDIGASPIGIGRFVSEGQLAGATMMDVSPSGRTDRMRRSIMEDPAFFEYGQTNGGMGVNKTESQLLRFSSIFESMLDVPSPSLSAEPAVRSSRGAHVGRRGRGAGRPSQRGGRSVAHTDIGGFDSALRDIAMDSEAELLRNSNDYNILNDILGTSSGDLNSNQPEARYSLNSVGNRTYHSGMDRNGRTAAGRRSASSISAVEYVNSMIGNNNLIDSLPVSLTQDDLNQPTDLDDIELCEDDYNLWQGIRDPRDLRGAATPQYQYSGNGKTNGPEAAPEVFVPPSRGNGQNINASSVNGIDGSTCGLDLLSSVTETFGRNPVGTGTVDNVFMSSLGDRK